MLKEIFSDDLGDFQSQLLVFGERISSDQLHDFVKFTFFLENFLHLLSQVRVVRVEVLIEVGIELFIVVGGRDGPVDGREVLSLGELLLKSPEDLDDGKGGGRDWISEISSWWGYGSDDSDGTFSVWRSQTVDSTGSLVELGQLGSEIGWVTSFGWHFGQSTGDFSESLSPSGGGISHHGDVLSLISEVLSKGDTSINGGLSGCDWHVGGIGDQTSSLHDRNVFSVPLGGKFREISQHLSHFVSSFSASDVDDDL